MSKLQFAVFSDLHAHNYKSYDKNGSRLNNSLNVIREIFAICKNRGIDIILFGGDLYHLHKVIPTEVVNAVVNVFTEMFYQYPGVTFYAINGNHDFEKKNLFSENGATATGALKHLSQIFSNFRLLDGLTATTFQSGITFSGIPYYDYSEHFLQAVQDTRERLLDTEFNVLITHQTPAGLIDFPIPSDTDPTTDYEDFDLVLNGHIHTRRQLTDKYFLIGSPLAQNFSDPVEDRGFMIFTVEGKDFTSEFVKLDYPKFLTVRSSRKGNYPNDYLKILPDLEDIALEAELTEEETNFDLGLNAVELVKNYAKHLELSDRVLGEGLNLIK